jgi:phosphate/sulfate permease
VRWGALRDIAIAWVLTVPASALFAMPLYLAMKAIVGRGGA